ncbi:BgTH12-03446 [Blumeria graminis f. sp. triticale]|uniref:BgTH12-03446 n=3 Tax=Blumeria graminis TaxID=34373 RepID=A0A9W4GC57_BLUGR|nr:BgTH12-03446 [Blumeria graminis f. sp. triticale]
MSENTEGPFNSDSDRETAARIVRALVDSINSSNEISTSGELYRAIGRYHRIPRTALYRSGILSLPFTQAMTTRTDSGENLSQPNENENDSSPLFLFPVSLGSVGQAITGRTELLALARQQIRSTRPSIQRDMEQDVNLTDNMNDDYHDSQRSNRQFEQTNLERTDITENAAPDVSMTLPESRPIVESIHPRVKRRKYSPETRSNTRFTGFNYGRYGQVEPGKLKMEIVSCDGGIFEGTDTHHPAENILQNDNSVYCTKSNRCNLILQHQGATVFCLKELSIKAPHSGYTAPVQEGMVFISMTSDDLLTRTAQYQIQYSPARSRIDPMDELFPVFDTSLAPDDGNMTPAQLRVRRLLDIGLRDEDCDYRTAQIPIEFIPENAPLFSVTTECSDSDSEITTPAMSRRAISRNLWRTRLPDDSESNEEAASLWQEDYARRTGQDNRGQRLRRRETARSITLSEASESLPVEIQKSAKTVDGGLMAPHARFFIERDKSKCTVKFDPPVSGRFILLKMWSPHHDSTGNIDIQSVVATGFAGPRYFPAIKWR